MGTAVSKEYEHYLGHLPERQVANDLARRLEGKSHPLTDAQREWFIEVLHATVPASGAGRQMVHAPPSLDEFGNPRINEFGYFVRVIPDTAAEPIRRGLTPEQMEVFLAIQREQAKRYRDIPR